MSEILPIVGCPRCHMTASSEAWDEEARSQYGHSITTIEDVVYDEAEEPAEHYYFTCPYCYQESSGDELIITREDEDEIETTVRIEGNILNVREEEFMEKFLPWLEEQGWSFAGYTADEEDEHDEV